MIQFCYYWLFKGKERCDLNYLHGPTNGFYLCCATSEGEEVAVDCKVSAALLAVHEAAEMVVTNLEKHYLVFRVVNSRLLRISSEVSVVACSPEQQYVYV